MKTNEPPIEPLREIGRVWVTFGASLTVCVAGPETILTLNYADEDTDSFLNRDHLDTLIGLLQQARKEITAP